MDNHEIYLSSSSTDHHNATSAKNDTPTSAVVIVDSNGAVNDITAPVNPLTAVQPVMYSKVAEDVTKVLPYLQLHFCMYLITLERCG